LWLSAHISSTLVALSRDLWLSAETCGSAWLTRVRDRSVENNTRAPKMFQSTCYIVRTHSTCLLLYWACCNRTYRQYGFEASACELRTVQYCIRLLLQLVIIQYLISYSIRIVSFELLCFAWCNRDLGLYVYFGKIPTIVAELLYSN